MPLVRNKKASMTLAALLVLIFHLWIPLFRSNLTEQFFIRTAYVGVDMFFVLSAYSLARREVKDVKKYYLSRFEGVYGKFLLFALVAGLVGNVAWNRLPAILTGIELVNKGGGAFLWFLPAILIVYLIHPLFAKADKGLHGFMPLVALILWFAIGFAITEFTKHKALFIFWNRIPALLLGYALGAHESKLAKKLTPVLRVLLTVVLLAAGSYLLYRFGFRRKLSSPITEIYYVLALPQTLGLILLADFLPKNPVTNLFGGATLEVYALQMIFGFKLADRIARSAMPAWLGNVVVVVGLYALAWVVSELWKKISTLLHAKTQK